MLKMPPFFQAFITFKHFFSFSISMSPKKILPEKRLMLSHVKENRLVKGLPWSPKR